MNDTIGLFFITLCLFVLAIIFGESIFLLLTIFFLSFTILNYFTEEKEISEAKE